MDSSTLGKQVRQKRILPTRTRRGGPGVGNCDVDMMILDTQRRKPENEPLIPADTQFLLTTNSALASTSSSNFRINVYANERYFERPEVLKAYREQSIIETPEFQSLGDTTVGRLRARSQAGITEDGPVETSDAVYEKRHRKFETWEKRARLREKEKLKHDQYKLKERIDQLRVMDASAFLALPDDLFPAPPPQEEVEINDEEGNFLAQLSGGQSNGEGERRRKEMLRIAYSLEERFRLLLPPDRTRRPVGQVSVEPYMDPDISGHVSKGILASPDIAPIIETVDLGKAKLKLATRPPVQAPKHLKSTPSQKRRESFSPPKQVQPPDQQTLEVPITQHSLSVDGVGDNLFSPQSPHVVALLPPVAPTTYHTHIRSPPFPGVYRCLHSPTPPPQTRAVSLAATSPSNPEIAFLQPEPCGPEVENFHEDDHGPDSTGITMSIEHQVSVSIPSRPIPRPRKRPKLSPTPAITTSSPQQITREPSVPPIVSLSIPFRHRSPSHASTVQSSKRHGSYAGASENERLGMLMTQAIRSSESRASKGQRHWYAFGGKVHNELFSEEREYEIPDWVEVLHPRSRPSRPHGHKKDAELY